MEATVTGIDQDGKIVEETINVPRPGSMRDRESKHIGRSKARVLDRKAPPFTRRQRRMLDKAFKAGKLPRPPRNDAPEKERDAYMRMLAGFLRTGKAPKEYGR